jgi:tetratricopeptide (TPR) repeat protein
MRLDPRNPLCHMALARLHYTLGEYDLAVAMAREAVRLNPNSALAHINLGVSLFGANRYEESLKHKDTALRLSPNDPDRASMLSGRAIALFMLGSIRGVRGKRA